MLHSGLGGGRPGSSTPGSETVSLLTWPTSQGGCYENKREGRKAKDSPSFELVEGDVGFKCNEQEEIIVSRKRQKNPRYFEFYKSDGD